MEVEIQTKHLSIADCIEGIRLLQERQQSSRNQEHLSELGMLKNL